ncbi:MAG: hypothetical protein K1060chlam1_00303 [Candidatus Anoxychlamydiales bacterium]|nr:hypothetical protein [Candidatus Anoxychlamydiales bacterium]
MSSAAGAGVIRNGDRVFVGSGSVVMSGSCMSGCGSCFSIKIISWKECNTLSKKIGFVFGKAINFMINLVSKTFRFLSKTIKILYIDKIFEVFYKIMKGISKKLYNLSISIFEKCIKPIVVNKLTKKIYVAIDDYLINPIYKIIRDIFTKILFKDNIPSSSRASSSRAKEDSKIVKISKKFLNFIKTILKPIYNWTLVPLYNRILSPILNAVEDIFLGVVSGSFQKEQKPQEEQKIKEE